MKTSEKVAAVLFIVFMAWLVFAMIEQSEDCERRGGIMIYKTGCIKAERI